MRPPQPRRPRTPTQLSHLGIVAALHLGTVLTTGLLLRLAIAIPFETTPAGFAQLVMTLTDPLTWPLAQIPGLASPVIGSATPADVLTLFGVAFLATLLVGATAGWRAEGRHNPRAR